MGTGPRAGAEVGTVRTHRDVGRVRAQRGVRRCGAGRTPAPVRNPRVGMAHNSGSATACGSAKWNSKVAHLVVHLPVEHSVHPEGHGAQWIGVWYTHRFGILFTLPLIYSYKLIYTTPSMGDWNVEGMQQPICIQYGSEA